MIRLAERSLRAFVMGVLGWVPVLGIPLAFLAILFGAKVGFSNRSPWNPGRSYAILGCLLGFGSVSLQIAWLYQSIFYQDFWLWVFSV